MPPDPSLARHPLFIKGVDEFNKKLFFECHETLEELWQGLTGDERELTQGIIQIAVGYHHLLRNNPVGALKLFKRGLSRVAASKCHVIDDEKLCTHVSRSIDLVESGASKEEIELPLIAFLSN